MDRTVIDNIGKGVESDTLRRRAFGIGGDSEDIDFVALCGRGRVLLLQREIKLCLRPECGLAVLRSKWKGSSSSSSSESLRMPKNRTVGTEER